MESIWSILFYHRVQLVANYGGVITCEKTTIMAAQREVFLRRTPAASNLPSVPRHTRRHTHTRTAHNSQIWSSVHIHEYLLQMQICTHTLYRCKAKHTHPNISTSFIVQLQPCNTADLNANLTHSLQNEWRFNTFNTPSHVELIRAQYFCKPSNPPSCTSVMHLFISGKHNLDWVSKPQHKC